MKKNTLRLLSLLLAAAMLFSISAAATDMGAEPPGGFGGGGMMGPPPGGGEPGMSGGMGDSAPQNAAIRIVGGAEDTESEYEPGAYSSQITVGTESKILGLELASGDYTYNGIVVKGQGTSLRLENANIHLSADSPAASSDTGGNAVSVDDGASLYISDSELIVDGAARYVTACYNDAKLIVNSSKVISTGSNENTTEISEPRSNEALLISGNARANFSVGATKTYYFNSECRAEGWAALSTDSATGTGLDLYAYNSDGIAENGGYGTYADTNCHVWLYGSRLSAAEIGCIISKSGQIHAYNAAAADDELLQYNEGDTVDCDSSIIGGRNAVMIHAPDMMGQGAAAADCGTFTAENTLLATSSELVSTKDYNDYGEAVGAYIDYVTGDIILMRSTSADIALTNVQLESTNGVLLHTVLNSDSMGNFLADGDGANVKPITLTLNDMTAEADILHEDYQRIMTVALNGATLCGNIVSGTMESWNEKWAEYGEVNWVVDEAYESVYGVGLTMDAGSVWNVTGESSLTSLTMAEGAVINGDITLDGEALEPEAGVTYEGSILVSGSYVAPPEEEPEAPAEQEEAASAEEPAQLIAPADAASAAELIAPAAEAADAAEASAAEASAEDAAVTDAGSGSGNSRTVIVIVVLAVVVIAAAAAVLLRKKRRS